MLRSVGAQFVRACFRSPKFLTLLSALWAAVLPGVLAAGLGLIHIRPAHSMQVCDGLNLSQTTPPRPPGGAGANNQDINFGDFTFEPGDRLVFTFQTAGQGGGVIRIDQILIGGQGFLGVSINLVDGVVENLEIVNAGSSPVNGDLEVEISNAVVGAQVTVSINCVPVGGAGGNDNAGGGLDGIRARDQVTGTFSVTNPETVDGSVFDVFGVSFSKALFEQAIEAQRIAEAIIDPLAVPVEDPQQPEENVGNLVDPGPVDGGNDGAEPNPQQQPAVQANRLQPPPQRQEGDDDDDSAGGSVDPCAECRRELAALQAELAQTEAQLTEANNEVEAIRVKAEEFVSNNRLGIAGFELDDLFLNFNEALLDRLAEAGADETPNEVPSGADFIPGVSDLNILEFAVPEEVPNAPPGTKQEDIANAIRDAIDVTNDEARGRDLNANIEGRIADFRATVRIQEQNRLNSLRQSQDALANNGIPSARIEIRNAQISLDRRKEKLAQIERQLAQNEAAKDSASASELPGLVSKELDLKSQERVQDLIIERADGRLRRAQQDLALQEETLKGIGEEIDDARRGLREENFDETFDRALGNARELARQDALVDRLQRNLRRVFFETLGGKEAEQRAGALFNRLFELRDQVDDKEGKLLFCIAQSRQSSLQGGPSGRAVSSSSSQLAVIPGTAFSGAAFSRLAEDNDRDVSAVESFGARAQEPGRVTIRNGIAAISKSALKARFDLRSWRSGQAEQTAQTANAGAQSGAGEGDPLIALPGFLADERFNLFASTTVSLGENAEADQDSVSFAISGGISWLVHPRLNVGLAGRYQDAEIDGSVSDIDADTWGISAFAQSRLPLGEQAINLEGIVAYSRSNLDSVFNNVGVVTTADSTTEAFSTQVKASESFRIDNFSVTPFVSVTYIQTDQEAFVLSDEQLAPGATNDQVTLSSGASLSTSFELPESDIVLSPSLGVGAFGTVTDGGNLGVSANGGLGFKSKSGIGGGFGVGFSGLTGDAQNLSFSGNISIPLN